MRLATYNVEWFNALFDDDGALILDDTWSGRWDVTKSMQANALGAVFRSIDADAIMVVEAPDTSRHRSGTVALATFAAHFGLRTDTALIGFANDTQQEITLLYDPDIITATHAPHDGGPDNPAFDSILPQDGGPPVRWSKPPLEVALTFGDTALNLIGVHAKSKAPHGAVTDADVMRISIDNRRKQLAQCVWLRKRVDQLLATETPLIVMGDFNDGPGLDEYESLFGRSGIEIVLGEGDQTRLYDPHARMALGRRIGAQPSTARFRKRDGPWLQALLDYIMVSPGLRDNTPRWQIWHPFDHPECYADLPLRDALLTASDHFPVVLDIDI